MNKDYSRSFISKARFSIQVATCTYPIMYLASYIKVKELGALYFNVHNTLNLRTQKTHTMDTLVTEDLNWPSRRKRLKKSLSERCQVCSDKASTQHHYGSKVHLCFSCRAFFRRCVQKNRIFAEIQCNNYILQAAGTCQITPENRSVCRYVTVV